MLTDPTDRKFPEARSRTVSRCIAATPPDPLQTEPPQTDRESYIRIKPAPTAE